MWYWGLEHYDKKCVTSRSLTMVPRACPSNRKVLVRMWSHWNSYWWDYKNGMLSVEVSPFHTKPKLQHYLAA